MSLTNASGNPNANAPKNVVSPSDTHVVHIAALNAALVAGSPASEVRLAPSAAQIAASSTSSASVISVAENATAILSGNDDRGLPNRVCSATKNGLK